MARSIYSTYGNTLARAAQLAIAAHLAERELLKDFEGVLPTYRFDFHGLELPLNSETTAENLVAQATEVIRQRAAMYESSPIPPDAHYRSQSGKTGESIESAIPCAVQCGQLWGNGALRHGPEAFLRLRHQFEFNGLTIPFNPWAENEAARVLEVARAELAKRGQSTEHSSVGVPSA
jgi:hypothetical protein